MSDVIIAVAGKEFPVHKVMLSARSPVFQAMFQNPLKESKQNRIEITDLDEQSAQQLLEFIYTGIAPPLADFSLGLLAAAEKYQISSLKPICESSLEKKLTVGNVLQILQFAELYSAQKLKVKSIEFIVKNSVTITRTDEWQKFKQEATPSLGLELFEEMSKQNEFKNLKINYFVGQVKSFNRQLY